MLREQKFSDVSQPPLNPGMAKRGKETRSRCALQRDAVSRFGSQDSAKVTRFTENIPGPRCGAFRRVWLPLFPSTKG